MQTDCRVESKLHWLPVLLYGIFSFSIAFNLRPGSDDLANYELVLQKGLFGAIQFNLENYNFRPGHLLVCWLAFKGIGVVLSVRFIFPLIHFVFFCLNYFCFHQLFKSINPSKGKTRLNNAAAAALAMFALFFGTYASNEIFGSSVIAFFYYYPLVALWCIYLVSTNKLLKPIIKLLCCLCLSPFLLSVSELSLLVMIIVQAYIIYKHRNPLTGKFEKILWFPLILLFLYLVVILLASGTFHRIHLERNVAFSAKDQGQSQVYLQALFVLKRLLVFVIISLGVLDELNEEQKNKLRSYFKINKNFLFTVFLTSISISLLLYFLIFKIASHARVSFISNSLILLFLFYLLINFIRVNKEMKVFLRFFSLLFLMYFIISRAVAMFNYSFAYDERLSAKGDNSQKLRVVSALPASGLLMNGDVSADTNSYNNILYKNVYGVNIRLAQ